MPIVENILLKKKNRLVVWEVTEPKEKLIKELNLNLKEKQKYHSLPLRQALEYLGVKACLRELSIFSEINHTEKGKPFIDKEIHISISHSHQMVAVAIGKNKIGIDIELSRPHKLENIQPKFIRKGDEALWLPNNKLRGDYLHIIWGIKESLYKLEGGNLWNFLDHYIIHPFNIEIESSTTCTLLGKDKSDNFKAHWKKIKNYYLIWVVEE